MRRCKTFLEITPYTVLSYAFDKNIDEYEFITQFENPVLKLILQTIEEKKTKSKCKTF